MDAREYTVTYITKDGEEKEATMVGYNHRAVERQVAAMGGTVLNITRAEEEYPRRVRTTRRTVGCATVVLLLVALAIAAYWYRLH